MIVACWSGPRNISTALMRSWSSRSDTEVLDEPFYSYYLKKTKLNHPQSKEIIKKYPNSYNKIVEKLLSNIPNNKSIWYQKQMAHHLLEDDDILFIKNFQNCFLIRHPKKVISSYTQKNTLRHSRELGYIQQCRIISFLKKINKKIIVIDSQDLLENPEKILKNWCSELNIKFSNKMLSWKKGIYKSDGIWAKHWYNSVISTSTFDKRISRELSIEKKYLKIFDENMVYYEKMKKMALK